MNSYNLYLSSFKIDDEMIDSDDKILVTFTTVPDGMQDAILVRKNQMKNMGFSLPVSIHQGTKDVNFFFSKIKTNQNDSIIGSSTIHVDQLPKLSKNNKVETQSLYIFEINGQENIGKIVIHLILPEAYTLPQFEGIQLNDQTICKNVNKKCHNENGNEKNVINHKVYSGN